MTEVPVYAAMYALMQGKGVRMVVRGVEPPVCVLHGGDGWRLEIGELRSGPYPQVEPAALKSGVFSVTLAACGYLTTSFAVDSSEIVAAFPVDTEGDAPKGKRRRWL